MTLILPMTALYNGQSLWGYVRARVENGAVLWVEISLDPQGPTSPGRKWAPFCAMSIVDIPEDIELPEGQSHKNRIVFTMFKGDQSVVGSKSVVVETPEEHSFSEREPRIADPPPNGGVGK